MSIPTPSKDFYRKLKSPDSVIDFLSAPIHDIKLRKHKEIMEQYIEMCLHIDRRANNISFRHCQYFAVIHVRRV